MATVSVATAGPLRFGRVFNTTFGVIGRHWLALAVISVVCGVAPSVVIDRAHVWSALPKTTLNTLITAVADWGAQLIPIGLTYAAATVIVADDLEDRRPATGKVMVAAIASLPCVFFAYVLM